MNPHNDLEWRMSSYTGQGDCWMVAEDGDDVLIKDSKMGDDSPILRLTRHQMRDLVAGIKSGEFDDLA